MFPGERAEAVLYKQRTDKVPFVVYNKMIPPCESEREFRNRGLAVVQGVNVFECICPDVKEKSCHFSEDGRSTILTELQTPAGTLTMKQVDQQLDTAAGRTVFTVEKFFKGPEDYKKLLAWIKARKFIPAYEKYRKTVAGLGRDFIIRTGIGLDPLHMMINQYMGIETFCMEWEDNRDEIMKIYDALVEEPRLQSEIIADSPAKFLNYGGNIVAEIIGRERFEKFVMPCFQETANILHSKGKLMGSHFDANCKNIADLIDRSGFDYIEAFTPDPDTDMTMQDAYKAWPDKVMWMNFPSSIHLSDYKTIKETAIGILDDSKGKHLLIEVSEDVPDSRWRESFKAIMDAIDEHIHN